MSDNNVLKLSQPSTFSDPLTEVLRSGARSLLARAVEAEVAAFLDGHSEARTEEGRRRLVRHGHLPEREIMTGIGPVAVRAPRVRDRTGQGADRIRFSSALLPPYARSSTSLEVLIPVLYLNAADTALADADTNKTGFQVTLDEGANTIKVKVTAQDGISTETYTVVVTRAAAGCAQDELWCATLTVKALDGGHFGCANSQLGNACSNTNILTEDEFTYASTDYDVGIISKD